MKIPSLILAVMLFSGLAMTAVAQDEWREVHDDLELNIASLTKQLELLELEREKLHRELDQVDPDARVEVLRREIAVMEIEQEMNAVRSRIVRAEHQLRRRHEQHHMEEDEARTREFQQTIRRVEHMRAAHEHLRAAGLDELAMQVADRAERLQESIEAAKDRQRLPPGNNRATADDDNFRERVTGAIRELNAAVVQLREELQRLRDELDRN